MISYRQDHYSNEAYLRLAMQADGVGMWDWDLIQNQMVWTNECKAIFGLVKDAEVSNELFLSLIHPHDREIMQNAVVSNLQGETEGLMEYRVIWPDGSLHWIASWGRSVNDCDGKPIRMIGIAFDVTQRKQAEEVQRQADRSLFGILENVEEAFVLLDSNWRFTYVNSRAVRIGREMLREDLLGQIIWEMYPEIVGLPTETYFREVMQTRQPAIFEIYYPDIYCWYDIRAYPAEDGGIAIFISDITERKALEEERDQLLTRERIARIEAEDAQKRSEELVKQLEHKQAFLHTIIGQAPTGMIIAEAPSGKVVLYNQEAARILGHGLQGCMNYTEYAAYGAIHTDGTPYRAEEYPLARALISGEAVQQEDTCCLRSDGSIFHLAVSATPINDEQGHNIAAVCMFHDISERYELEHKKDEFISLASHELRTPLTSIKGNLQLVERRLQKLLKSEGNMIFLAPEGQNIFENINQWIERALRQANAESRLIDDLLDATRAQREKLRVILKPCNLTSIVLDAINDVRAFAGSHIIDPMLADQPEIPVLADKVRIGQVVTNYLVNALKYSDDTRPVRIFVLAQEGEARVEVRDNGPGLTSEAREHVWDRFYQMPDPTGYAGPAAGLGLGLYISQALIHQHGGQLGVESEPGWGATFWFTLPLIDPSIVTSSHPGEV